MPWRLSASSHVRGLHPCGTSFPMCGVPVLVLVLCHRVCVPCSKRKHSRWCSCSGTLRLAAAVRSIPSQGTLVLYRLCFAAHPKVTMVLTSRGDAVLVQAGATHSPQVPGGRDPCRALVVQVLRCRLGLQILGSNVLTPCSGIGRLLGRCGRVYHASTWVRCLGEREAWSSSGRSLSRQGRR